MVVGTKSLEEELKTYFPVINAIWVNNFMWVLLRIIIGSIFLVSRLGKTLEPLSEFFVCDPGLSGFAFVG